MTSLSQVCVALHPFSTLAPWPPPPQVLSDSYTAGREQFFRAYLEYQKAMEPLRDLASLGVLDVDMGPLCENIGLADLLFSLGPKPSVAGPQRDEWRALLARLYHEATVCTDATRTMDLLDGAGKASKGLSSHLKGYLSHERQGELADGIKNDLRPKEGKRGGVATICGGVHYQCAEEFATTSANAKQSDCLAGVVDEDTIPVLRSFLCSGATHECFLMFDLILIPLLMACPHVRVVLVDHGCKYGKHLKALESLPAEIRDRVTTGVPMMHAEVHILSCRLLHSSLYIEGLGYIPGESSEQLWNQLKPFTKSTRNMTWANHLDFMNLALRWITKRKVAGLFKASWCIIITMYVCMYVCIIIYGAYQTGRNEWGCSSTTGPK